MQRLPAEGLSVARTLLVTGAAGGLGREVVGRARALGWHPVAVSRDAEGLAALAAEGVTTEVADVSTPDGASAAIQACRRVGSGPDGLVNCAGQVLVKAAHRTTDEEYRSCLTANLDTAFYTLQAFVSALREDRRGGAAVFVSTVAARIGVQNHEAVAAAKGGVEALVRSAAATYASAGIRVNGIAPGLTETPAVAALLRNDAARAGLARQYPLGRYGQPADLAAAILWLLSDEAAWVTGEILAVDGGFAAVRPMVK